MDWVWATGWVWGGVFWVSLRAERRGGARARARGPRVRPSRPCVPRARDRDDAPRAPRLALPARQAPRRRRHQGGGNAGASSDDGRADRGAGPPLPRGAAPVAAEDALGHRDAGGGAEGRPAKLGAPPGVPPDAARR